MSVKNQLNEICGYYGSTNGIGHTTAVIKGFNMTPMPVAVVHTSDYGKSVFGQQNYVSLDDLVHGTMRGVKRPLVIDNVAMQFICREALDTIATLETENSTLRIKLEAIQDILNVKI